MPRRIIGRSNPPNTGIYIRLSRTFKFGTDGRFQVTPIAEVFNLFNIANYINFSEDITSPDFGQPTARVSSVFGTGGPRAFQFAVKVRF